MEELNEEWRRWLPLLTQPASTRQGLGVQRISVVLMPVVVPYKAATPISCIPRHQFAPKSRTRPEIQPIVSGYSRKSSTNSWPLPTLWR